jgi:hypothetical protein
VVSGRNRGSVLGDAGGGGVGSVSTSRAFLGWEAEDGGRISVDVSGPESGGVGSCGIGDTAFALGVRRDSGAET